MGVAVMAKSANALRDLLGTDARLIFATIIA